MRFDDMLATVLARRPEGRSARVALWRQLLDLLAQQRDGGDRTIARAAFDRVVELRAEVPVAERRETAAAIAGRPVAPAMVALIAGDVPQVAGEMLSRVRLSETEWLHLLPRLSPTARGFLRHRRDLGSYVEAALSGFGHSDLAIAGGTAEPTPADVGPAPPPAVPPSSTPVEPFEPGAGEGQIRAIISRIARFRSDRDEAGDAPVVAVAPEAAVAFHFETGVDGIVRWVSGVPRGPLIGETIAAPAHGAFGVDAQAPGAFRRRAPFRDARLLVPGTGEAAGEWRIAAVPLFAPATGRFLGYRGTGRRPRADERAEPAAGIAAAAVAAPAAQADSLRQLVHELRTPLNAIGGFAEMIRRQMRGPVAEPYRDRADRIAEQAVQLLAAVDDLDVAARLDSARLDLQRAAVDLAALIAPVCAEIADGARGRGVSFACALPDALPPAQGDPAAIRRIAMRLMSAAAGLAGENEAIAVALAEAGPGQLALTVARPARLANVPEAALFDPGYGPDGDWPDAPLLGLGFSLHLVRRLAGALGGQLQLDGDHFILTLPAAARARDAEAG